MNILKQNKSVLFFPLLIIYFEVLLKLAAFNKLFDPGLALMVLFSIPIGLVMYLLSLSENSKRNKAKVILLLVFLTVIYGAQFIYYKIFNTFLSLYSIVGASKAIQFFDEVIIAVKNGILPFLLVLLPIALTLVFIERITAGNPDKKKKLRTAEAALVIQIIAICIVFNSNQGELSNHYLYYDTFIIDMSVKRFGLLTTEKLDVKNLYRSLNTEKLQYEVPKTEEDVPESDNMKEDSAAEEAPVSVQGCNSLNIDFDSLIQNESNNELIEMHRYFSGLTPTAKNEFTGRFKGKNLILIVAEGFSPYAVNKDITPTLYKMYDEGYKFTDFYTPLWGVSTSDGEYAVCTGLIPKAGIWSFYRSSKNYLPFCLGNQLKQKGFNTLAYHNHYFDYYKRDESHPNMGYVYKGLGNGLDVTETWPESDVEMIDLTKDEYIQNQPFHVYYMTVSGHMQYTFEGNYIANKNKDYVEHLSCSDSVKAYLACNVELDKAMESLIKALREKGIAENTVIAITPDHYPYGLKAPYMNELAGHSVENSLELYKSVFLLWSEGIEPVTVSKPCSSIDILPTLSNLMGLEFDSRLIMGRDIFSDSEPLVLFNNRSWITDKASYNSETKEFAVKSGSEADESYKERISNEVREKFKYSALILDKNYYGVIMK